MCFSLFDKKIKYSVAIKKPKGTEYYFYDFEKKFKTGSNINEWIRSKFNENYSNYLLYNDEEPEKPLEEYCGRSKRCREGHCKGVLKWNNEKISWLIHSIPKYPIDSNFRCDINHSELEYGQSMIHFEVDIKYLNDILNQIYHMNANIYMCCGIFKEEIQEIQTIKILKFSKNFKHISKPHNLKIDIYENCLSYSKLNKGNKRIKLETETWIRGQEVAESEYVKNIKKLKEWKESSDHSKWCISDDSSYRVYIGDLNRMTSQHNRGGGGIVIDGDKNLWYCFKNLI